MWKISPFQRFEADAPDETSALRIRLPDQCCTKPSRCSPVTTARRRPLAGGQSLMPMMAFRVAQPSLLVDLRKLPELRRSRSAQDGVAARRDGALARHPRRCAARHGASAACRPRSRTSRTIRSRNRGTVGGSLAHADPAAEMPGIAHDLRCGDRCRRQGRRARHQGGRFLPGRADDGAQRRRDHHRDSLCRHGRRKRRYGFQEFARRRGDFAMAAARCSITTTGGKARNAHIGVIGVGDRPMRLPRLRPRSTAKRRRGA